MLPRVLRYTVAVAGLSLVVPLEGAMRQATAPNAVPLDPKSAIFDAFKSYQIVGLGDAHGNLRGEAFQLDLIRDPRFTTTVNDIIVELGNARHQAVVDRFVRGEEVPADALQRVWLDTTAQHIPVLQTPEVFNAVRKINASLPPDRRVRILLGEPPIDWDRIRTENDWQTWEKEPMSSRDRFAADLLQKEVLSRKRRVLALYGAGHFFRRNVSYSLVSLLEDANVTKAFTIWTNAAADLAAMQPDVAKWPVPSLTRVQGTVLGQRDFADYFGPDGKNIPDQWRAKMQEQFDAVLYIGPLSEIAFAKRTPFRCSDPSFAERIRRLGLQRPPLAERLKKECVG